MVGAGVVGGGEVVGTGISTGAGGSGGGDGLGRMALYAASPELSSTTKIPSIINALFIFLNQQHFFLLASFCCCFLEFNSDDANI